MFAPHPDDLSTWQRVPLPRDPGLDAAAAGHSSCRIDLPAGAQLTILLQDRRTQATAAFLVRGPETAGSCMVSTSGGDAGGASQPARQLQPLGDAILSVDEDGSGGLAGGTASMLGGRSVLHVAAVRVHVAQGEIVEASVAGGHWLAWWPGEVRATRVVAIDEIGDELGVLTLGPDGWAST